MMLIEGPLCSRGFEFKIQRIWRIGGEIRRIPRCRSKFKACCSNKMSTELLDSDSQSGRHCDIRKRLKAAKVSHEAFLTPIPLVPTVIQYIKHPNRALTCHQLLVVP